MSPYPTSSPFPLFLIPRPNQRSSSFSAPSLFSLFSFSFPFPPIRHPWPLPFDCRRHPQTTTRSSCQGSLVADGSTTRIPTEDDVACGPRAALKVMPPITIFCLFQHLPTSFPDDSSAIRTKILRSSKWCPSSPNESAPLGNGSLFPPCLPWPFPV